MTKRKRNRGTRGKLKDIGWRVIEKGQLSKGVDEDAWKEKIEQSYSGG